MPSQRRALRPVLAAAAAVVLATGCSSVPTPLVSDERVGLVATLLGDPTATASAQVLPLAGSGVEGRVSFSQYGAVVIVRAKFIGMPPNSEFGLHVHEARGCTREEGLGRHLNPGSAPHGPPGRGVHHAGDLPNMKADSDGYIAYSFETAALSITAGPTSVVGRVIVVSSAPDDYRTQPDGNSGSPIACGFIRPDGGAFGVPIR